MRTFVRQFRGLGALEDALNGIESSQVIATHVGTDEDGWWAVLIYWGEEE